MMLTNGRSLFGIVEFRAGRNEVLSGCKQEIRRISHRAAAGHLLLERSAGSAEGWQPCFLLDLPLPAVLTTQSFTPPSLRDSGGFSLRHFTFGFSLRHFTFLWWPAVADAVACFLRSWVDSLQPGVRGQKLPNS